MLMAASIQQISVRVQREIPADVTSPFFSDLSLPAHVAKLASEFLEAEREQVLLVFLLDGAQRLIAYAEATRGSVDAPVIVRDVFRAALVHGAAAIAVAHNDPNGGLVATEDDVVATFALMKAGEFLGIPLLDHVIVATDTAEYYSFRQMGTLAAPVVLR